MKLKLLLSGLIFLAAGCSALSVNSRSPAQAQPPAPVSNPAAECSFLGFAGKNWTSPVKLEDSREMTLVDENNTGISGSVIAKFSKVDYKELAIGIVLNDSKTGTQSLAKAGYYNFVSQDNKNELTATLKRSSDGVMVFVKCHPLIP